MRPCAWARYKQLKSTKRSICGAAAVVLILGLAFPAWAASKAADDAVRRGDYDNATAYFLRALEISPTYHAMAARNLESLESLKAAARD